jgi:death-on-curing protein
MGAEAYPDLAVKAAALLESVARFHPLIDGNKRTAWTLIGQAAPPPLPK